MTTTPRVQRSKGMESLAWLAFIFSGRFFLEDDSLAIL